MKKLRSRIKDNSISMVEGKIIPKKIEKFYDIFENNEKWIKCDRKDSIDWKRPIGLPSITKKQDIKRNYYIKNL